LKHIKSEIFFREVQSKDSEFPARTLHMEYRTVFATTRCDFDIYIFVIVFYSIKYSFALFTL